MDVFIDSDTDGLSVPFIHLARACSLLRRSGWEISSYVTTISSVNDSPSLPLNEDQCFLPNGHCKTEKIDELQITYGFPSEFVKTTVHENISRVGKCLPASMLTAVLSLEVECDRAHLVPAWCVLVPRGHLVNRIQQYLQQVKPFPQRLCHLKRIDSCRFFKFTESSVLPVLLGLAESGFCRQDAVKLIADFQSTLIMNDPCDSRETGAWALLPSWVPLCAPITRKHQALYSFPFPAESTSQTNSPRTVIDGWPTTLRVNPDLEKQFVPRCEFPCVYFSATELQIHNRWLERVRLLVCNKFGEYGCPQSCAGFGGPANAVVIVDPKSDCLIAQAVTPNTLDKNASHLDHAVILAITAVAETHKSCDQTSSPPSYLCSGLHAYVSMEPCVMCAMALLHSRIRSVFCGTRLPCLGGFTNRIRLHISKKLNHRFQVYAPTRTPDIP